MDAATIYSRKQRLKKAIDKSFKSQNLGKNGKFSSFDRQKVKKLAVGAFKQFVIKELNTPKIKTYDFWFIVFGGKIEYSAHQQNNEGKNRYFIIDEEGAETPMNTKYSFSSTTGSQRIRELEVYSHEISTMISSSNKLFDELLRITVSEEEDRKIYAAYDTVDEKKIFMVTIGLPLAIIGAVEALPIMLAYGESAALPSLGKAFTVNSFRAGLYKGGSNLFGQLATNDFRFDEGIDYADPLISGFTGGWGSVLGESAFELRYGNNGFTFGYEGHQNFLNNTFTNTAGNMFGNKLDGLGKPLNDLSPNISGVMIDLLGGSFIESGENVLGNEIKIKLNINAKQ